MRPVDVSKWCQIMRHSRCDGTIPPVDGRIPDGQPFIACGCPCHPRPKTPPAPAS